MSVEPATHSMLVEFSENDLSTVLNIRAPADAVTESALIDWARRHWPHQYFDDTRRARRAPENHAALAAFVGKSIGTTVVAPQWMNAPTEFR